MKISRRALIASGAITLTGCANRIDRQLYYKEIFKSLAISPNGDTLAIIGREFDYIFKPPANLIAAIKSNLHSQLSASFNTFELDSEKEIKGEWTLQFNKEKNQSKEIADTARALGFADTGNRYVLSGSIEGTRFLKNHGTRTGELQATNQTYVVQVSPSSKFQSSRNLTSSPISQGGDGALIIGLIILLPLILIINPCITCR